MYSSKGYLLVLISLTAWIISTQNKHLVLANIYVFLSIHPCVAHDFDVLFKFHHLPVYITGDAC